MTLEHIKKLAAYNMERGDLTKQAVLNVVKWNGKPISPQKITDIIFYIVHSELTREYESGRISKMEFDEKIKEQTITIRTVHRKLSSLVSEGLLHKTHGKYELAPKAKSDMRYFARECGNDILNELMLKYIPADYSVEGNAEFMVRLFGAYLLFCFMETARPMGHRSERDEMYGPTKDEVIPSCLQNLVRINEMFDFFLSTLDYITSNDNIKRTKYNKNKLYSQQPGFPDLSDYSPGEGAPSAVEINVMYRIDILNRVKPLQLALEKNLKKIKKSPLTLPELKSLHAEHKSLGLTGFDSSREVSEDKLQTFRNVLSKACPDIYPRLSKMISVKEDNPKQKLKHLRETLEPLLPM